MENSSVCAIVVSFHPSFDIVENIERLRAEFRRAIVVDNTCDGESEGVLQHLERIDGCSVIRNCKNLGIAAALNIGIRHALSGGVEWVFLFDQDSRICDGYLRAMLSTYRDVPDDRKVGILFPRYEDSRTEAVLPIHRTSNGDVFTCMTSGSMIHANTLQRFGLFDERLFIDYVDVEYSLRLRGAGLKIVPSEKAILMHSLGRISGHAVGGKKIFVTNHSAKRRYYITRNRLVVMKRYLRQDSEWVLADLYGMFRETIKLFLVEKHRLAKAGYMLKGIFDAVFNRLGPRVPL